MGVKLVSASGGSVEINPPATASNFVATMPAGTGNVVVNGVNGVLVSGTAVASTSGTSIDFTGIPSWVKRITVMFSGVSTSGTSNLLVQIGDSGGIENTGYVSGSVYSSSTSVTATSTAGYILNYNTFGSSATTMQGVLVVNSLSTTAWVESHTVSGNLGASIYGGGTKTLSDTLDRVRITTVNGTDTFDAGSINILYE